MDRNRHMGTESLRRLAKILAMTTSVHDAEALAATRKANGMMAQAGISYGDLFEYLDHERTSPAIEQKIARLQRALRAERTKSATLAAALKKAEPTAAQNGARPLLRSLEQLRRYLMGHMALKTYERDLLSHIEDPEPKTKEAHIVLICAQRYGVSMG